MAKSVNKVILIGNLGKDPEIRRLENGVAVSSFSLATTESFKDRNTGEVKSQTDWHNIVMWRGLAEVAEKYLKKGMQIYIEGKIRSRSYQDKEGNTKYITEIVADNMVMMSKNTSQGEHSSSGSESTSFTPSEESTDDLPF